jgi:hypothetical protein
MEKTEIPTELLKYELRNLQLKVSEESRSSFLTFVKKVWPEFVAGSHHKIIAKKFEDISRGKIKRLIVNMPAYHKTLRRRGVLQLTLVESILLLGWVVLLLVVVLISLLLTILTQSKTHSVKQPWTTPTNGTPLDLDSVSNLVVLLL